MFSFQNKLKQLGLIACSIAVILFPSLDACSASGNVSMFADGEGNTYAAWSLDGTPNVSVKLFQNSWSTSVNLSTDQGYTPCVEGTAAGQVVVAWMGPQTNNSNQYTIFVSMYVDGSWTQPQAITDPNESIVNASFGMTVQEDPTNNGQATINVVWTSWFNNQLLMRTNSAAYGVVSGNPWVGPTTLP